MDKEKIARELVAVARELTAVQMDKQMHVKNGEVVLITKVAVASVEFGSFKKLTRLFQKAQSLGKKTIDSDLMVAASRGEDITTIYFGADAFISDRGTMYALTAYDAPDMDEAQAKSLGYKSTRG